MQDDSIRDRLRERGVISDIIVTSQKGKDMKIIKFLCGTILFVIVFGFMFSIVSCNESKTDKTGYEKSVPQQQAENDTTELPAPSTPPPTEEQLQREQMADEIERERPAQ